MLIEQARRLKKGQMVRCPADRGMPAYNGEVVQEESLTQTTEEYSALDGAKYIWVEVKGIGKKEVWPSNRLG